MNEQTLVTEFNLAVMNEPPLGFDPDDAVTRAALRYRRRQANLLVGFGVVAVAAVAVAASLTLGHPARSPEQTLTAGPAASGPVAGTVRWPNNATTRQPKPTVAQLKATGAAIEQHMLSVLPTMSAGAGLGAAPNVITGQFAALELGEPDKVLESGAEVTQPVTSPNGTFSVTVGVDALPAVTHPFALGDVCAAARHQINPAVTCSYARQSDGTLVMTMNLHSASNDTGSKSSVIWVTSYRPDGLMVSATTGYDSRRTDGLPLTEAQVTALATDPAFTLTK